MRQALRAERARASTASTSRHDAMFDLADHAAARSSTARARRRAPPTSPSRRQHCARRSRRRRRRATTIDADGLLGHPRLRRHPHALRRAAALGPDVLPGVVARGHDAAHRQLRVHARAVRARRSPWLLAMLSRVEGMSADALEAGVTFTGGSLRRLPRRARRPHRRQRGRNVGHCAVRRWSWATTRPSARPPTTRSTAMRDLVRAAMRDGAVGFTSSQLDLHVAHDGRPRAVEPRRTRRAGRAGRRAGRVRPGRRSSSSPARSSPATTTPTATSSCGCAAPRAGRCTSTR